jgi:tungstate transport system ATP-binding protein
LIMDPEIYRIKALEHHYNGAVALKIDTFSVAAHSITGLIGPNGSGKSTLLNLMAFLEHPTSGEIFFKGSLEAPFSPAVRSRVTLLSQEPYLLKRSVFDNVAYGLKVSGQTDDLEKQVARALSFVGISFRRFANRKWYELSGGETQRVALAARLVLKPEVLLLDEPTASVDAESAGLIREASLRAREEWGTTLAIASHDWHWLYEICDEVVQLQKGRMFGVGLNTLIPGPWEDGGNGTFGKRLRDGQAMVVSTPPDPASVAIIGEVSFSLNSQASAPAPDAHKLMGMVSRLILVRKRGTVLVTVMVGDIAFSRILDTSEVERLQLSVGRCVSVTYRISRVSWV